MPLVLLIDSNEALLGWAKSYLNLNGYDVAIARRGEDAVSIALKRTPDLILLGDHLPDATGFQVCIRIRRYSELQAVPLLLMSGLSRFRNQQEFALERGATGQIPRPSATLQLGEIVDRYVVRHPRKDAPQNHFPFSAHPHTPFTGQLHTPKTTQDA
jgi:two-component system sensor histidine kinase/response regulator